MVVVVPVGGTVGVDGIELVVATEVVGGACVDGSARPNVRGLGPAQSSITSAALHGILARVTGPRSCRVATQPVFKFAVRIPSNTPPSGAPSRKPSTVPLKLL